MGIDILIRSYARESWAHQSFLDVSVAVEKLGKGYVKIDDCLTRLTNLLGPRFDGIVSTLEFYELFMAPIRTAFVRDNVRVYIAMFDDENNKSDRKKKLHVQRDTRTYASSGVGKKKQDEADISSEEKIQAKPYDQGVTIVAEGIYDFRTKQTTSIDLKRFKVSRHLRYLMYFFFQSLISHESFLQNDRLLIFEYSQGGPIFYPSIQAWPQTVPKPPTFLHNHGESDPSVAFWASVFRSETLSIVSIDTDIIPIVLLMIANSETEKEKKDIMWFYGSDKAVDMRKFAEQVTKSTGLSAFQFVLYCILCKTDYVDKGLYARGFGCLPILEAVIRGKSAIQSVIDARDEQSMLKVTEDALTVIVRCLCDRGRSKEIGEAMRALKPYSYLYETTQKQTSTPLLTSASSSSSSSTSYGCIQTTNIVAYRNLLSGQTKDKSKSTGKALATESEEVVKKGKKRKLSESLSEECVDDAGSGKGETSSKDSSIPSLSSLRKIYSSFKKYSIPTEETLAVAAEQIVWNLALWNNQATMTGKGGVNSSLE